VTRAWVFVHRLMIWRHSVIHPRSIVNWRRMGDGEKGGSKEMGKGEVDREKVWSG